MKILIADKMHLSLMPMLAAESWEYEYLPKLTRDEILERLPAYDGLIIRSKTAVDQEFLRYAANLKFIARAGAGLDLIDVEEVGKLGIQLFHAGEGNRDTVAEHVLGMLLSLFNNLNKADREVRQRIWDREGNRGVELMGKTVGLIGFGNNGSATAVRLSGFGCRVLAYDKYKPDYGNQYAREATLEDILREADIISLHVPLTAETLRLVDEDFIDRAEKPFYLVNAARGEIVSLEAVVKGLESGKLKGACLDVLENEKLQKLSPSQEGAFDYLCGSDKVILSPHIAGWSHESYVRINEVLCRQIGEWYGRSGQ